MSHLKGSQVSGGYVRYYGFSKPAHIVLAEKALGRKLPKGAQVHHWDENKRNNDPSNLVICPNQTYHKLLHRRMDSYNATGSPDNRICYICHVWGDPIKDNMYIGKTAAHHRTCMNEYNKRNLLERNLA